MKSLIYLTLILLSACHSPSKESTHKHKTQLLQINTRSEPRSLDPRCCRDISSSTLLVMLFDGLVRLDNKNKPILSLAEKYEVSEDGKTYTFHLREAHWTDGTLVTAQDFAYTWQHSLMPNFPSDYSHQLYLLKNGQQVKQGLLPKEALGVQAISEQILQVELEHPTPYFLQLLAHPIFFAIPQHIDQQNPSWMNHPTDFVSNGPFAIDQWAHGNAITVKKNLTYWDQESVKLNSIQVSMIEDEHTELYMFENGELDWAGSPNSSLPHDAIPSLKASGLLHISPMAELFCFKFNTHLAPFNNVKIRQAFCLAINRKKIIDNVLQNEQIPALRFLSPMVTTNEYAYYEDNSIQKARSLFNQALKENNLIAEELPPIILTYTRCEKHHRIAEALQQQWQEAFNIPIRLQSYEWNVFLDHLRHHNFQIAGRGWVADFLDGMDFLQNYQYTNEHPLGGNNDTYWQNPLFVEYLDKAKQCYQPHKRENYLLKAEAILMEEYPVAPFLFAQQCYVKSKNLTNVILSPTCRLDFKWAYFDKAPLN